MHPPREPHMNGQHTRGISSSCARHKSSMQTPSTPCPHTAVPCLPLVQHLTRQTCCWPPNGSTVSPLHACDRCTPIRTTHNTQLAVHTVNQQPAPRPTHPPTARPPLCHKTNQHCAAVTHTNIPSTPAVHPHNTGRAARAVHSTDCSLASRYCCLLSAPRSAFHSQYGMLSKT